MCETLLVRNIYKVPIIHSIQYYIIFLVFLVAIVIKNYYTKKEYKYISHKYGDF